MAAAQALALKPDWEKASQRKTAADKLAGIMKRATVDELGSWASATEPRESAFEMPMLPAGTGSPGAPDLD